MLTVRLSLEANGDELRFHNPATGRWLPTSKEALAAATAQAKAAEARAATQGREAESQRLRAEEQQAENERLRREIELLKRGHQPGE